MSRPSPRAALTALAALSLASATFGAQQFQYQPGLIPGPARWSEGVECADVDNDGDLDIFVADGEGFASAGAPRQNVLLINLLMENGSLSFADESVARLGVNVSHAKGVTTGDVNGDGWIDAFYSNAFNTSPPFLYVNRGALGPGEAGHFDQDGANRGFTQNLSSAGAQFGDLDDDGDLDLVVCDSGPSYLGAPGGKPRLYWNDGNGFFTEAVAPAWNPPVKMAHRDVQLADVNGDWQVDFVGFNRANNSGGTHYLMLNDGQGGFTNASTTIPNTSSNVYEGEVGDLDGDGDLDLFFVSLTGFQEGAMRNELVPSGVLGFTSTGGLGLAEDDNEIALFDFDSDGDLDVFVGSLGARERLWRNDGNFVFTASHASIQAISDSTLDMTVADLDNDGAYDLVTVQGESNQPQWANKVYLNLGPPDDLPPVIVAVLPVAELDLPLGPWIAKAKARDQVMDDGVSYVRAFSRFVVNPAPLAELATIPAGSLPSLVVSAGTTVTWDNVSGVDQTVTSTTAPYTYDSGLIAPGASWSRTFVSPGIYGYTSLASGLSASVTVIGAVVEEKSTPMGIGQYRFRMAGDASAPESELCYELFFVDWPGNQSVSESYALRRPQPPGTPYCAGDGSGTPCPCANSGAAESGCANGTFAEGCALAASGAASVSDDSLALVAERSTPSQPGLFFQGDAEVAGGSGLAFGDGLRCAGANLVRLQIVAADASGDSASTIAIAAAGNVQPGDTKHYQLWYRDPLQSPCGAGFNLSNGLRVDWNP